MSEREIIKELRDKNMWLDCDRSFHIENAEKMAAALRDLYNESGEVPEIKKAYQSVVNQVDVYEL